MAAAVDLVRLCALCCTETSKQIFKLYLPFGTPTILIEEWNSITHSFHFSESCLMDFFKNFFYRSVVLCVRFYCNNNNAFPKLTQSTEHDCKKWNEWVLKFYTSIFPYEMFWRNSDKFILNGGIKCRWGM